MKHGFTLIELLIVVLIIGILAAIALPQYQTAVDKARYSTMMSAVRALKDAQELYYLSNGNYANDMYDLEGALPGDCKVTASNIASCKNFELHGAIISSVYVYGQLKSSINGVNNSYLIWLDNSSFPGRQDCYSYKESKERGLRLCKSLGGEQMSSTTDGDYTVYKL